MPQLTSQIIGPLGHATRFSDSSFYDEVCMLCGATDAGHNLNHRCSKAVPEGATEHWVGVSYSLPTFEVQRDFVSEVPRYRHRPWSYPMDKSTPWIDGDSPDEAHHF